MLAPQVQFSPSGGAAVAFSVRDVDNPAISTAFAARRAAGGRVTGAQAVPGAQQALGLAADSGSFDLLTGESAPNQACCGSVSVVRMSAAGRFGRAHRLLGGLSGAAAGQLLNVSGRLIAAVATGRGVWIAQSSKAGRFGAAHLLTSSDARPEAMSAAPLAAGGAIVAWTERDRRSSAPRQVFVASGATDSAPGGAHAALSVPSAHRIDELSIAGSATPAGGGPAHAIGPTLAWIESWYDKRGGYHSQVQVADLAHPTQTRSFAVPREIASALSFAESARGDQLLSWKACDIGGSCSVRVVLRRAGRKFGTPSRVGSVDTGEEPAATLAPDGTGLVGWIDRGQVLAAALPRTRARLAAPRVVSGTGLDDGLALGFGPTGTALAVWSEGTSAPEVFGAVYKH